MNKTIYIILFLLSGTLLVLLGIICEPTGYDVLSPVPISVGTTVISIVLVNFLWERSGGEPILKTLETLRESSQLVNDSIETGVRKLHRNRRAISYPDLNNQIANAQSVAIMSLVLKVALSLNFKRSLKKCVGEGGRVRILVSSPTSSDSGLDEISVPLKLRMVAEKDTENQRIPAEINDTLSFLKEIGEEILAEGVAEGAVFQVKMLATHAMYFSTMQIDDALTATHYSNKHQGIESPTVLARRTEGPRSLFGFYSEEFDHLWKKADWFFSTTLEDVADSVVQERPSDASYPGTQTDG